MRGLDLTQNHFKLEKKTKKKRKKEKKKSEKKMCSERDLNPPPSDYRSCRLKLQSALTPVKLYGYFSKVIM